MFITRISLLTETQFNLFHNIPVPIQTKGNNLILIDPKTRYLAFSTNKEYNFTLTENQYSNCKQMFSFKLCISPQFINKRSFIENCEVSLYNKPEHPLNTCILKYIRLGSAVWQKLTFQNAWLYTYIIVQKGP